MAVTCSGGNTYQEVLCYLVKDWGLLEFFIPFFLFYIIPYVIIKNTGIFEADGNEKKQAAANKFATIMSLIISLVATLPNFVFVTGADNTFQNGFLAGIINPVAVIMASLPGISLAVIISILSVIVLKGSSSYDWEQGYGENNFKVWTFIGWFMVAFVIYVFMRATFIIESFSEVLNVLFALVGIVIVGLFLYYVFYYDGTTKKKEKKSEDK